MAPMRRNFAITAELMRRRRKFHARPMNSELHSEESNTAEQMPETPSLMSKGGAVEPLKTKRSEMLKMVLSKSGHRLASGGMVQDKEDFLSADAGPTDFREETYPDPDNTEVNDPKSRRKGILSSIMRGLHKDHFGK